MAKPTFLVTNDCFMSTTCDDSLVEYKTFKLARDEAIRCVKQDAAQEVYIWRLAEIVSMAAPDLEYVS